jgi:plasmid stabilization system protein ParE
MPAAKEDLACIRNYYLKEAGTSVARQMAMDFLESFRFLARTPGAGHIRQDLAEERPILFWPMRDYLILYKRETNPLEILSVFRGSRDLPVLIGRRKL